jgi:hypothetical protein
VVEVKSVRVRVSMLTYRFWQCLVANDHLNGLLAIAEWRLKFK